MFLFKNDIPRIQDRKVIPVFSGRDGCLATWPGCCVQLYAKRAPGQAGRYPGYAPELLARLQEDMQAGARNIDLAEKYVLPPATISAIRKRLGLQKRRYEYPLG